MCALACRRLPRTTQAPKAPGTWGLITGIRTATANSGPFRSLLGTRGGLPHPTSRDLKACVPKDGVLAREKSQEEQGRLLAN